MYILYVSPHSMDISLEIWVHILHVQRNTSLFHSGVSIPSTAAPWHQLPSAYIPTDQWNMCTCPAQWMTSDLSIGSIHSEGLRVLITWCYDCPPQMERATWRRLLTILRLKPSSMSLHVLVEVKCGPHSVVV